jgi:hypothetical protein
MSLLRKKSINLQNIQLYIKAQQNKKNEPKKMNEQAKSISP